MLTLSLTLAPAAIGAQRETKAKRLQRRSLTHSLIIESMPHQLLHSHSFTAIHYLPLKPLMYALD